MVIVIEVFGHLVLPLDGLASADLAAADAAAAAVEADPEASDGSGT